MRVVIHNPHTNFHFGNSPINTLLRIKSFKKYKYLIDYALKENKELAFYVDGESSFPAYISKYVPVRMELLFWCLINNPRLLKVKIIKNLKEIGKDDVFLSFALENLEKDNKFINELSKKKTLKLFHLSHFVQNTSKISSNFKKLDGFLIAENNLYKNSAYFRKMFPFYKRDVYYLPFVFEERFKRKELIRNRKNRALATGTIIRIKEFEREEKIFKDFSNFYKSETIHPMREEIYKNKTKLKPYIDSYISNFWETDRKSWKNENNFFKKWSSRLYNAFFATKRDYLKFDIVEKYNEYKMFIVPEEINNLPGIGFIEGMACGSAYIGIKDPMYQDLGLKPGKHYISYNGKINDLILKIKYYQKNQEKLKMIAEKGHEFILENMNGEKVAKDFWENMEKLHRDFINKKKLNFKNY